MMESKTCWQYAIDFRNMDKTIVDWEIRLYKLNKPFAMICGLPILNYQEVGEFFLDKNS